MLGLLLLDILSLIFLNEFLISFLCYCFLESRGDLVWLFLKIYYLENVLRVVVIVIEFFVGFEMIKWLLGLRRD